MNVGIWGVGSYLPPEVRTNEWWPKNLVEQWSEKQQSKGSTADAAELTEGQLRVAQATASLGSDPFRGSVERRIMPQGMLASEMETEAAKTALASSGVEASEIDLLLVQSTLPDFLHTSNASALHRNLGLRHDCFVMSTEGMCNAFAQQLTLASSMLQAGRAKRALIIQSANLTRLTPAETPGSAWVGDGATAAVLGEVGNGFGILADSHSADGELYGVLVTGVPNGRWWEGGRIQVYVPDLQGLKLQFMNIADHAKHCIDNALLKAGVDKSEVKFLACHQATPWLPTVVKEHVGLMNAVAPDTYKSTTSLNGCNLPLILEVGLKENLIHKGDIVCLFSGAAGVTNSAVVVRWG